MALHLGPSAFMFIILRNIDLSKTDECNRMIRTSKLGAAAQTIPVIDDSPDVMLDAFIDSERNCNNSFARQLFKVTRCHVVIDFKLINLEEHGGHGHSLSIIVIEVIIRIKPAFFLFVSVAIVL